MRLDVSQQMKMDQRMIMAPRMIQSMEILQLPLLALQERIEQEMLANPVLEMEEVSPENNEERTGANGRANNQEIAEGEKSLLIKDDASKKDDFERLENVGDDFDDYLSRSSYLRPRHNPDLSDRKLEAMQNTAAPAQSLNEYLHKQWVFVECPPLIRKIGSVIIDLIDEAGYLTADHDVIRENLADEVTDQQIDEAITLVQSLEPTGVGARNLAECMKLQLADSSEDHSLEIELVTNHIKDIEMNRYPAIARKTGRSLADIKNALKNISHLDPRPGLQIGRHDNPYITPDIIVEYDEGSDTFTAHLADGGLPLLHINNQYKKMLKQNQIAPEAKEYLKNSIRSAQWLIESIEQRKATLMRVVNQVLNTQRDFFDRGPAHLKPMPMVEVADQLGIHVGTVSRAVSGKYMQTPTGIYPLRYFFSSGMENAAGESVSWDAVKAKLQEIVDNEDKSKPYNDDELVKQLQHRGLTLARRTVAKYRSLMNIPPARRRKQF